MNRLQIGLKLGLDILRLSITPNMQITQKYYQEVCDKVYQAEQIGVHIKPQVLLYFNKRIGHAFSPLTHEDGGNPSINLLSEIHEIKRDLEITKTAGFPDDSESWGLDNNSIRKLESLISTN